MLKENYDYLGRVSPDVRQEQTSHLYMDCKGLKCERPISIE